jgi:anti-sigma factor RsiW
MSSMRAGGERNAGLRCDRLVELVTDHLEGALDDATVAEVEAHVSQCPGCATYLDQMRETVRTLRCVPLDGLSDDARARLLQAFEDIVG